LRACAADVEIEAAERSPPSVVIPESGVTPGTAYDRGLASRLRG
jgi:hypothetical protein